MKKVDEFIRYVQNLLDTIEVDEDVALYLGTGYLLTLKDKKKLIDETNVVSVHYGIPKVLDVIFTDGFKWEKNKEMTFHIAKV